MKSHLRLLALLVAILGSVAGMTLWAATQNALVTGSVYDQNGAGVPGATVRLINPSIGFSQTLPTDANGNFTFSSVPPGDNYIISVEIAGFATVIRPGMSVAVGEAKLVLPPFILQPAAQPGQEIKEEAPKAAAVSLDLVSTTLGGVIDSRTLRTLPLVGRDFLDLALLIPGTYPVEQGSALEGASLVVNGVRPDMNDFLLDGGDNNDYTVNQSLPFQIVEAMQEFRVQTSTSNAEFGRNAGAQVNLLSRSGSNELHGTVFWFNRNSGLSADQTLSTRRGGSFDAFAQAARINAIRVGPTDPTAFFARNFPTPVLSDPVLSGFFEDGRDPGVNQNQFGANLGGRLVKDKAFFFFNWESARADNDRPVFERVPGLVCRSAGVQPAPFATCSGALPAGPRLDRPRALALLNLYPAANIPTSTVRGVVIGTTYPLSDPINGECIPGLFCFGRSGAFIAGDTENTTDTDNFLERIDVRVGDAVSLNFKHNIQRIEQVKGGTLLATSRYPGNGTEVSGRNQNFSFNYLHQISARTGNELRFGWNRFRLTTLAQDRTLDASANFFNLNFDDKGLPTLLIGGYQFTVSPYAPLGADFTAPSERANNVFSFADNLSYTRGRHVLKLGGELRHNRLNAVNEALGRGFSTFFTVPFAAGFGGPDMVSIARVNPAFGGFDRSFDGYSYNWFVQDTWRPRSNLSLTFGVRHEINIAPRERRNRLANFYPGTCPSLTVPAVPAPVTIRQLCLIRSASNTILDTDGIVLGTAPFRAPRAGFHTDLNNVGPHIGVAWDPRKNGKTVIRAAYAATYDQQSLQASANMLHNPPFMQQWVSFFPFAFYGDTFPAGFPDPAVPGPACTPFSTAAVLCDLDLDGFPSRWYRQPYSIVARDPNTRTSYVHQWNLGVQRQIGGSSLIEVGYVGSAGHKLPRLRLALECDQLVFDAAPEECMPLDVTVTRCIRIPVFPFFSCIFLIGTGAALDSAVIQENTASSNYHSLQARWESRNWHGLTLRALYEWGHSIDIASSANPPLFFFSPGTASIVASAFGINADQLAALNSSNPALSLRPGFPIISTRGALPNDSQNLGSFSGERANSDFDIRQRFVIHYIYDVPRFAPGIGHGWQVAGITTFQSGQPFSVFGDFFGVPLRPDLRAAPALDNDNAGGAIDNALPSGCNLPHPTSPPPALFLTCSGTTAVSAFDPRGNNNFLPGSLPRNPFKGPGLVNFDFSILKNTYIGKGERVNVQFRVEVFNLLNSSNFRQPFSQSGQFVDSGVPGVTTVIPNPFFGQILQARPAREIQWGLKLIF